MTKINKSLKDIKLMCYDIPPYYQLVIDSRVQPYVISFSVKGPMEMAPQKTTDGYIRYGFSGVSKTLHRLVAEFVYGPCPPGKQVNHIDGNKLNNNPDNLEYITAKENIHRAMKLGMHVSNDPTRSGRYKDGRAVDVKAYKHQWYLDHIELCKLRTKQCIQRKQDRLNEQN